MQTHFQDNHSDELIIFFDGWGMDARPYSLMKNRRDVLYVYDYKFLDFSKYKKISLIAYSAGVFMAGYLKDVLPKLDFKIAVNGVLDLFNPQMGLPHRSISMMENVSLENYMELRKELISDENQLMMFNKIQPLRDIESSLNELSALHKYAKNKVDFDFDKVIMGRDDKIIPFENQKTAWAQHKNTSVLDGGHFLFYNFNSFDDIVEF